MSALDRVAKRDVEIDVAERAAELTGLGAVELFGVGQDALSLARIAQDLIKHVYLHAVQGPGREHAPAVLVEHAIFTSLIEQFGRGRIVVLHRFERKEAIGRGERIASELVEVEAGRGFPSADPSLCSSPLACQR